MPDALRFLPTKIPGVVLIEPTIYSDARGSFAELAHAERFAAAGLPSEFLQDNFSRSIRGTLRGLHAQLGRPQGKLVRAVVGRILDVAVDIRRSSPTFKQWVAVELDAESLRQIYVPPGFLHGFSVLSDGAHVEYKCTDVYSAGDEISVRWNDPELAIDWHTTDPILSEKDRTAPLLRDVFHLLPA